VSCTHHEAPHFVTFSSLCLFHLRVKYPPQHPVLLNSQSQPSLQPIQNNSQGYISVYFN